MSAHERHSKPTWLTLVYNKATPTNLSLPLNSNLGEWIPKCDSRGIHTDLNPPKKMPRALMLAWVVHIEKPSGFTLARVSHFKTPKGFKPAWDFMSNHQDDSLAYRDCKSNPPWHESIPGLSNSWFYKNLQFQFTQFFWFDENYGSDSNYFKNLMKPLKTILSRVLQIPTPLVPVLVPTRANHKVRFKRLNLESGYLDLDSELAHNKTNHHWYTSASSSF